MGLAQERVAFNRLVEGSLQDLLVRTVVIDDNYDKTPRQPAFEASSSLPIGHIALVGDFPKRPSIDS